MYSISLLSTRVYCSYRFASVNFSRHVTIANEKSIAAANLPRRALDRSVRLSEIPSILLWRKPAQDANTDYCALSHKLIILSDVWEVHVPAEQKENIKRKPRVSMNRYPRDTPAFSEHPRVSAIIHLSVTAVSTRLTPASQ